MSHYIAFTSRWGWSGSTGFYSMSSLHVVFEPCIPTDWVKLQNVCIIHSCCLYCTVVALASCIEVHVSMFCILVDSIPSHICTTPSFICCGSSTTVSYIRPSSYPRVPFVPRRRRGWRTGIPSGRSFGPGSYELWSSRRPRHQETFPRDSSHAYNSTTA